MSTDEYAALKADIAEHGLLHPVVLYKGRVLDGRHRMRACRELGVEVTTVEYEGDDPVRYVIAANLHRRHLSSSQRAALALELLPPLEAEARGRQRAAAFATNEQRRGAVVARVPEAPGRAREQAGKLFGVSARYVSDAKRLARDRPEMLQAVRSGTATLREALAVADDRPAVARRHGQTEWFTPTAIVEAARTAMGGIDLDPASCLEANRVVNAAQIYIADDDGLTQRWKGRVWLNPPYATHVVSAFASKLIEHLVSGEVEQAIVLVNNATETTWFQSLAAHCSGICFPAGRVRYWRPGRSVGYPLQGQALFYAGSHTRAFREAFTPFGFVARLTPSAPGPLPRRR